MMGINIILQNKPKKRKGYKLGSDLYDYAEDGSDFERLPSDDRKKYKSGVDY